MSAQCYESATVAVSSASLLEGMAYTLWEYHPGMVLVAQIMDLENWLGRTVPRTNPYPKVPSAIAT